MGGEGGGAGGGVWLDADVIEGWGSVSSLGGSGASDCGRSCISGCCCYHRGGGGGGGRVRTYGYGYSTKVLLGHRAVSGATPGGEAGSLAQHHGEVCSDHGAWNGTLQTCACRSGYHGCDCQYRCEADTCGAHGACSSFGTCACDEGYVGQTCQHQCSRQAQCSSHGSCSQCGRCVCDGCYHGDDCSRMCNGRGQCSFGQCVCDACHLGEFCESECNGHGSCTGTGSDVRCDCEAGWTGAKCTIPTCPGVTQACSGHGDCVAVTGRCFCQPGWTGKVGDGRL